MADRGKETPEEAFQRLLDGHTEDAPAGDDLLEMARLAQEMQGSWKKAEPRPDFEAALRYEFVSGAQPTLPPARRFPLLALRSIAGLLLTMLIVGGLFSAAHVASASALPGDKLYTIKRGIEATRLALPFENKAALRLDLAIRRMKEIQEEERRGRVLRTDLVWDMASETDRVVNVAERPDASPDLMVKLARVAEQQEEVLKEVSGHAPKEAQEALAKAMAVSQRGQERAMEVVREKDEADEKPVQKPKEAEPTKTKEPEKEPTRVIPTAKPKESPSPKPSPTPAPSPSPQPTPRPSPTIPSEAPKPYFRVNGSNFEMEGSLTAIGKDRVTVSGREVRINSKLKDKLGGTKTGAWVGIKGAVKQDGTLVAESISVKSGPQESEQGHKDADKGSGDGDKDKDKDDKSD